MKCRRQSRLSDGVCPPTRPLGVQELRGGQRGREDRFWGYVQTHVGQAYLQIARGVKRVISENQEGNLLRLQALHKLCCTRNERCAAQDDSIHIYQVVLDTVHALSPLCVKGQL